MAEQDDRQSAFTRAREPGQGQHVGDQSVPSAGAEVAERLFALRTAPVPAMVVGINVKPGLVENLRDVRITDRVLSHAVRNLHDCRRPSGRPPSIVGYLESFLAAE